MKNKKKKIRITEFEKKVYAACKTIPYGETRTYAWLAKKIGHPRACRAVGKALHKNPFAPAVPCHRVICSDGSAGGFAGGVSNKKRLLAAEKKAKGYEVF
ncbi:MAG: MGMT family protein [bacterium]|nr:MGMT family protein [bacterium]